MKFFFVFIKWTFKKGKKMQSTLYAGTIGQSVWRSTDNGDTWNRASNGLFPEADVRAIAVSPSNSDTVYAGTEKGIFRTNDAADSWHRLPSPMDELEVWAIAIDPRSSDTVYAGTCPSALFKSTDGGDNWEQLNADLAQECEGGPDYSACHNFYCRSGRFTNALRWN